MLGLVDQHLGVVPGRSTPYKSLHFFFTVLSSKDTMTVLTTEDGITLLSTEDSTTLLSTEVSTTVVS